MDLTAGKESASQLNSYTKSAIDTESLTKWFEALEITTPNLNTSARNKYKPGAVRQRNRGKRQSKPSRAPTRQIPAPLFPAFDLFSKLPIELRLRIWDEARPAARIVKLIWSKKFHENQSGFSRTHNITSRARVPNLLHTCSESREVALKWYQLSFGWYGGHQAREDIATPRNWAKDELFGFRGPAGIYFDWSRDFIYLQCTGCSDRVGGLTLPDGEQETCNYKIASPWATEVRKVTKIAIASSMILFSDLVKPIRQNLPSIEEVILLDTGKGLLQEAEAQLEDLTEDETPFWDTYSGDSLTEEYQRLHDDAQDFKYTAIPKKITRMQLLRKERFEKVFGNIKVDFSYRVE